MKNPGVPAVLASADDVASGIAHLAEQIVRAYAGSDPLFVCLLRGGAPFATRLMFAITRIAPDFHPELCYMMVKRYGAGREGGQPRILMDLAPDIDVAGRTAIILDDVLDNGVTAGFVRNYLMERGAKTVDLAVLVQKDIPRDDFQTATFHVFDAGPAWIAGMGMDDEGTAREAYRWLDEIIVLA